MRGAGKSIGSQTKPIALHDRPTDDRPPAGLQQQSFSSSADLSERSQRTFTAAGESIANIDAEVESIRLRLRELLVEREQLVQLRIAYDASGIVEDQKNVVSAATC